MGGAGGGTLTDSSGNGRNGTHHSAVTSVATLLVGDADPASKYDNTAAVVSTVADAAWMDTSHVTAEAWVKADFSFGGRFIVCRDVNGADADLGWRLDTNSTTLRWIARVGSTTYTLSEPGTSITAGAVRHVVGTHDGTTLRLYVNGAQVASVAASGSIPARTTPIYIGNKSTGNSQFNGVVDEVAVYDTALSAARILAHYNAGSGVVGPTTVNGTLSTETDAGQAGSATVGILLAGTLSTETDTAQAGSVAFGQILEGTVASETDEAQAGALTAGSVLAGTLATETDAVQAGTLIAGALVVGGQATELDLAMQSPIVVAGNKATEADAAQAGANVTTITGRLAQELSSGGGGLVRVMPPVTPAPLLAAGHAMVAASAFGAVTMQGSQPVYSISTGYTPRARQRIVVDGIDITYFRGGITPNVTYTLLEPLLYGPATLDLPQVAACFERPGVGALSFLRPGAEVVVQRVIDDVVVGTDWKGVVVAFDLSGRNLSVELGGEASGRAALRNRQVPIFPRVNDLGRQWADGIKDLGLSFYPPLGPVTGIEVMTSGGTGHLEWLQERIALGWTRSGRQWTVMPDESTGAYEGHRKDDTTIHGTAFLNDSKTVANLRRDIAEEPNRIYATGVTPRGKRVRFGVYPGLIQGPTPDFPGHMELGDSGDGVRLLIGKLHATGYLKLTDAAGGYDQDVYDAVVDLQNDAGLFDEGFVTPAVPGEVGIRTWEALYDLGVTGNSLEWAHIEPAAQRRKVRPWNRSATGGIMGVNPLHDPNHLVRDRNVDLGAGLNRSQMREFARATLHDSDDPNWVGDITFHTGALLRGTVAIGATITAANVMDARELRPGMNLTLPQFDGGTLVHIAAIQVDGEGIVTATVDTRFRDAMEVWEVIARNKESRNDPARQRQQKHRSSTIVKDSIGEIDEIGGVLPNDIPLKAGWNVFDSIAAAEGTMARLRLMVGDASTVVVQGDGDETVIENLDGQEFACAVFGRPVTDDWLNNANPAPLTVAGTKIWETKRAEFKERWLLYSAGTHDEPCGYSPGRKHFKSVEAEEPNPDYDPATDPDSEKVITVTTQESWGDVTGKHVDDAGFAYRSESRTVLHVAVWVRNPATLLGGRIMWPQLEAGV